LRVPQPGPEVTPESCARARFDSSFDTTGRRIYDAPSVFSGGAAGASIAFAFAAPTDIELNKDPHAAENP
jgi:hypothetical protein